MIKPDIQLVPARSAPIYWLIAESDAGRSAVEEARRSGIVKGSRALPSIATKDLQRFVSANKSLRIRVR